jgi:hypothetical protein
MKIDVRFLVAGIWIAMAGCANSPIGPGSGTAEAVVKGSVDDVSQRAQSVLQGMNIPVTDNNSRNSGKERQLLGKSGDTDVTVTMDNAPDGTTHVAVEASKNVISGNKSLAQEILSRIVQKG